MWLSHLEHLLALQIWTSRGAIPFHTSVSQKPHANLLKCISEFPPTEISNWIYLLKYGQQLMDFSVSVIF